MNNSIIVTPRDTQDYGQYVCHASNSFGSTKYKITLLPRCFVHLVKENKRLSNQLLNTKDRLVTLFHCNYVFFQVYSPLGTRRCFLTPKHEHPSKLSVVSSLSRTSSNARNFLCLLTRSHIHDLQLFRTSRTTNRRNTGIF